MVLLFFMHLNLSDIFLLKILQNYEKENVKLSLEYDTKHINTYLKGT